MAKFVYSPDDIKYTDGFAPEKYTTADDIREHKRKQRRKDKGGAYNKICEYIDSNNIMEFHVLQKRITVDMPDSLNFFYEKWNYFKSYVDSRRFAAKNGFGTMSYDEVYNAYLQMQKDYEHLRIIKCKYKELIDVLKADNLNLRKYICEIGGELQGDSQGIQDFWQTIDLSQYELLESE